MSAAALFSVSDVDPSIPTTLAGIDQIVADWVSWQLEMPTGCFDPCAGVGVTLLGEMIAGVVFNNYHRFPEGATMEASVASISPRWATRPVLRSIFSYPFKQMGVTRLQVCAKKSAKQVRKFDERLGFKMEGVARRLWMGKHDAVVLSMTPEECRWIDG